MKKYLLSALFLLALLLPACKPAPAHKQDGRLRIVATIFPEYDWVLQILGDQAQNADVTLLLDSGVDLHSYQATAQDIVKISSCDLFIYIGGESDAWVQNVLKSTQNHKMKTLNLLQVLGNAAKNEEHKEGMQHQHEEHEEEEEEPELDEHIWLSLKNASRLCAAIAAELKQIDPAHADTYDANLSEYQAKLTNLDAQYQETVKASACKTLLFGDRFPFRYLVEDYGLQYFAAFSGCSAEAEASFQTVTFLAKKVDELGLKTVLTLDSSNRKVAETIVANTASHDQRILSMDSMQSSTTRTYANGATYLSIMEGNLATLREALK